jgi:hypothetical protein
MSILLFSSEHIFLYELRIHLFQRDSNFDKFTKTDDPDEKIRVSNAALRENLLIEKYFGDTLKHSGLMWSEDRVEELKNNLYTGKELYK